jgi:hypothetical protein
MAFCKWSRTASANATADSTCPFSGGHGTQRRQRRRPRRRGHRVRARSERGWCGLSGWGASNWAREFSAVIPSTLTELDSARGEPPSDQGILDGSLQYRNHRQLSGSGQQSDSDPRQ